MHSLASVCFELANFVVFINHCAIYIWKHTKRWNSSIREYSGQVHLHTLTAYKLSLLRIIIIISLFNLAAGNEALGVGLRLLALELPPEASLHYHTHCPLPHAEKCRQMLKSMPTNRRLQHFSSIFHHHFSLVYSSSLHYFYVFPFSIPRKASHSW